MTEPIEQKFSLNTLPHPGFKVCFGEVHPFVVGLQYLENDPETPVFDDFHRCTTGGSIFHRVFPQNNHYVLWQPYPQYCVTFTVRWYHGFGRFSGSDLQAHFWRF